MLMKLSQILFAKGVRFAVVFFTWGQPGFGLVLLFWFWAGTSGYEISSPLQPTFTKRIGNLNPRPISQILVSTGAFPSFELSTPALVASILVCGISKKSWGDQLKKMI